MILSIKDLPSRGRWSPLLTAITLRPLTFLEIIEYDQVGAGSEIKEYIRDIDYLLRLDPSIGNASLYDLDYLIFMMKVHTISADQDFTTTCTCSKCKKESTYIMNLADFRFNDVDLDFADIEKVVLGEETFEIKVPTITEFRDVLTKYDIYQKIDKADIIKLISLFKNFKTESYQIEEAVTTATREDITVLTYLEKIYLDSTKPLVKTCHHCNDEEGVVMGLTSLITSMFRSILLNNRAVEDKILFRKASKSK